MRNSLPNHRMLLPAQATPPAKLSYWNYKMLNYIIFLIWLTFTLFLFRRKTFSAFSNVCKAENSVQPRTCSLVNRRQWVLSGKHFSHSLCGNRSAFKTKAARVQNFHFGMLNSFSFFFYGYVDGLICLGFYLFWMVDFIYTHTLCVLWTSKCLFEKEKKLADFLVALHNSHVVNENFGSYNFLT